MTNRERRVRGKKNLDDSDGNEDRTEALSESIYSLRLKEWSRQIPVAKISMEWEKGIVDLIPDRLKMLHPKCLEKTLAEVREAYESDMMNCRIASIVGTSGKEVEIEKSDGKWRRSCAYDYHYDVSRNRKSLSRGYFLSHEVTRRIIETGSAKLPRVIVDLGSINAKENRENFFELSTLTDKMADDVIRVAEIIKNEYHPEIVDVIARTLGNNRKALGKHRSGSDRSKTARLLRCAENLFAQRIVETMMKTIDELTGKLCDYRRCCPRVNLRLVWNSGESRLSVDPPIHRVYSTWHGIVRAMETLADDLPSFQLESSPDEDPGVAMKISLPEWYTAECHRRMDESLAEAISPLERYFEKIAGEFEAVTSGETRRGVDKLTSMIDQPEVSGVTDGECHSWLKVIDEEKRRATELTASAVEFAVGRLDRSVAGKRLSEEIAATRKVLVDGMLRRHELRNAKICRDFEDLRDKLLDLPSDPHELFKLGETIAYPSINGLLEEFESRVSRSMEALNSLLALTSDLSESHARLNGKTILWLADIRPIIARSNTLCEAMKSELEDDLQRRIVLLNADIEAVLPSFVVLDFMNDADRLVEYEEHMRDLEDKLDDLESKIRKINAEERLLKFSETRFATVEEIRDVAKLVRSVNDLGIAWRRDRAVWLHGPFEYVNADEVRRKTTGYRDAFEGLNASLKVKVKNDMQQTSSSSGGSSSANVKRLKLYTGVVDDPDPLQQPAPLSLCSRMIEEVKLFADNLKVIDCVCNPSLRERHWREISMIHEENRRARLGNDRLSSATSMLPSESPECPISAPDAGTTLAKLMSLDLAKDIEKYRVISISADKELALAGRLQEMMARWDGIDFDIVQTSPGVPAVKTFAHSEEIDTLMEEHRVILGEMKVSYFVAPIATELAKFSDDLSSVKSIVGAWLLVQREWCELETVFRRETTDERLARARGLFSKVSENVIQTVERSIVEEPKFFAIARRSSKLSQLLSRGSEILENVRETIKSYVEEARSFFPRFYFLSDRRVIDIIFEPVFSKRMRLLVSSCFADMRGVKCHPRGSAGDDDDDVERENSRVKSIVDSSGREFDLVHRPDDEESVGTAPPLVRPFTVTERAIRRTVRDAISECFHHPYEKKTPGEEPLVLNEVLSKLIDHSLQIAGVCSLALYWTSLTERALDQDAGNAKMTLESSEAEQSRMIEMMLAELRRSETSRIRRRILALYVIEVHQQREVTRLLMRKNSDGRMTRRDFAWMAQIRHYWREDRVKVAMFDVEEFYGYEYGDCLGREPIVRTPLTERCHHSLMEAHRNRMYGLVYGPPGSGKCATIMALARTLGVHFRVLDCAQGHFEGYRCIDNVFRGLLGCSLESAWCWLLLKNIDLTATRGLSILAQRVTEISRIAENPCFVIATISSRLGSSWFRSSSLPDAIKVSFRPVALAFPDAKRIAEILLFAGGFTRSDILAEKLRIFEKYSRSLYTSSVGLNSGDVDLRIVKTVVKTACALKNRYFDKTEDELVVRALVDVKLPGFVEKSDLTGFQRLMDDLFPNVALPPPNYERLASAIRRVLAIGARDPLLGVVLKVVQLYELLLVKHAVLVVGSALAAKSTVIDTLARSLEDLRLGDPSLPAIRSTRIYHRSFTSDELFGSCDESLGTSGILRWKDGILTRALRSFLVENNRGRETKNQPWQWLVLDGPPDPPFIDEFTSLLDEDCKTLYLSSGEKILVGDSTSVILETASAVGATPATISHCGIIFVEESSTIGWRTRTRRWVTEHQGKSRFLVPCSRSSDDNGDLRETKNRDDEFAIFFKSLIEWALGACLAFAKRNSEGRRGRLTVNENHTVNSVMVLLEIYLSDAMGLDYHRKQADSSVSWSDLPSDCEVNQRDTAKNVGVSNRLESERAGTYVDNFFSWSQAALLLSIVWALGGSRDRNFRSALDEHCRSIWRPNGAFSYDLIGLPSEGLIEDHTYVFAGNGYWRNFSDVIKKENISCDTIDYFSSGRANSACYVPTVDSVRYIGLFEIHVKHRKPFLVSGETAAGKSTYMRHLLKTKIDRKRYQSHFQTSGSVSSPGVSSTALQNLFISRMRKLRKLAYGPKEQAELCVNFIDDMSAGGASKVETILRQLIRRYYDDPHPEGCWHDVDSGDRISLKDVMFLGAIDSGGNPLEADDVNSSEGQEATRFLRHFNLYAVDLPTDQSIFRISYKILLSNLRRNMFSADVSGSVTSIVNATIELYSSLLRKLKPIPRQLQYRFNLRDVSRLVDGCSLIHKESAETKVTLMRLWVHEAMRTFADRVVDLEDADWLYGRMKECAAAHFKDTWDTVFDNLPKNRIAGSPMEQLTRESFRHLVFTDFMRLPDTETDADAANRRYEEATFARDALKNRAIFYLERYNSLEKSKSKLDILLFPRMLEHLLRICRVLDMPGSSLLMMSFGGMSSGRRSLAALAAHVKSQPLEELSCDVIESMVTPNSPTASWREDFKRACRNCISEGNTSGDSPPGGSLRMRDCAFFVSDRDIVGSSDYREILGDICSLMKNSLTASTGFFGAEEREVIVKKCRLLAQRGDRNQELSSLEVMDYFYNECREKLHFVLHFDGRSIRRGCRLGNDILRKIIDHCTVDCWEDWPETALHEIAGKFMRDIDMENRIKTGAIAASDYFWRNTVIAETAKKRLPVSAFIHTIRLYSLSINERRKEIRESRYKYLTGLEKLRSADEEVRKMRSTLTRLRPELESSAMETAETMRKIERENVSVEMASIQVKREEEAANEIAKVAGILKEECEADLAVAIPILEDAIAALNTLKPTDITLVKAMKNPPDTVKLVLAAVCVMLGVPPDRSTDPVTGKKSIDYWAPSKRILGDMNFLQNLKDYDKDNIASGVMSVVVKCYMNDENFMPHIVAKASSAAEGLCKWVRAMVSYDEVAKVVAPKKEKLAAAERECNAILEYLNEKRQSLAALNDKLAALKGNLRATLAKKLELENEAAICTRKLNRAETLIASLAGEKTRWLEAADTLTRTCDNLAGDVLLSCGTVALLSSLSAKQRACHVRHWRLELDRRGIPNSGESYEFLGSLRTNDLAMVDNTRHLHDHRLSLDYSPFNLANTSIVRHSLLRPLILDPQYQACAWIKRVESSNGLVVVKPSNPRWFREIRRCIENELPVLLENVDRAEYLARTPSILRYCDETLASSTFRLYMTSRISFNEASANRLLVEPHDMYKRFIIVNFTLANDALEDRLLEIIVSRERPELRDTFDRLMMTSAANKKLLDQEEERILEILSGSSVNIIEDERATEKLDRWKNLTREMRITEEETVSATKREMNDIRATYRPLTKYCAALYDTLASLVNFNHMYRFSLDWFIRLYVRSIDVSLRSVILDKRLTYLGSSFTLTLDASVRNALRDEHKLLYSFLLSIKILLDADRMNRTELRTLFLINAFDRKCRPDPATKTEPMELQKNKLIVARRLTKMLPEVFRNLPASFREDPLGWESYWNNDDAPLPPSWSSRLTDFQRLILVTGLKPERTLAEVLRLVENVLGWNSSTSSSSMRTRNNAIERSYEESSCVVPLIFVLPSYLQPHRLIDKWSKKIGYSSKILRYSTPPTLPAEQAEFDEAIDAARKQGRWILLENCHLATDEWLAKLEIKIESFRSGDETGLSFRLWLTSYPSVNFPISILHDGTKIYCEQPGDRIRENLLDFYTTEPLDDRNFYNTQNDAHDPRVFPKLVYALCFFHSIAIGRNRFDDLAWNAPSYEFTDSDLKVSLGYLRRVFCAEKSRERSTIDQVRDIREVADRKLLSLIETLTYLVGDCYYGGRILDPSDRDSLNVILLNCCNSKLVRSTADYFFYAGTRCLPTAGNGREYTVPNRTEYRDFVRHIKDRLPSGEAPPGVFGLDDNAAVLRDRRNSKRFVHSLARSLSFIDEEVSFRPEEEDPSRISDILRDLREKLSLANSNGIPSGRLDIDKIASKYPSTHQEPFNHFLIRQVELYNKIVEVIITSLATVDNTTRENNNDLVESLTRNRVPTEWIMIAGPDVADKINCSSLSTFIDCLSNRREFLINWTNNGHYSGSLWLGGTFDCRCFILTARLMFARKSGITLDRLAVDYEVTNITTDTEKPWRPVAVASGVCDAIYVHGLFLSGARWDTERSTLVETLPKLFWNPLPMMRLRRHCPDQSSVDNVGTKRNCYRCPVNSWPRYNSTSSFSFLGSLSPNYVTRVPLESKDSDIEHWIERRTLLFCNK